MHRLFVLLVVAGTVAIAWSRADKALAGTPAHTPQRHATQRHAPVVPPHLTIQRGRQGATHPMPAARYAYGWFGVKPRHHCVRHFGYFRNFTQWTAK